MKNKQVLMVVVAVAMLLLGLGAGAMAVMAVNPTTSTTYPPIVENLAKRFNTEPSDVKKVFDDTREERRQQMITRFEENLNTAVKEGKITKDQKNYILDRQKSIWKKMDEIRTLREELNSWAQENNVDLSVIGGQMKDFGYGRGGCYGGRGF